MATRGVPVRFVVWPFHLALPLLGLWLLLAVPVHRPRSSSTTRRTSGWWPSSRG